MIVRYTKNNLNIETPSRERNIEVTYISYLYTHIQYWTSDKKKNILTLVPSDIVYLNTRLASAPYICPEERRKKIELKKIENARKRKIYWAENKDRIKINRKLTKAQWF